MTDKCRYPLPPDDICHLVYRPERGLILRLQLDRHYREIEIAISTPFGIVARLRRADDDDFYGLRIRVRGMNDEDREVDIPRRNLVSHGAVSVMGRLFDLGLQTFGGGETDILSALKSANPDEEIISVSRRGWHWLPDPVFVAPTGEAIGAPSGTKIELENGTQLAPAGTVDGWREAIEIAIKVPQAQHWQIGAAAAFAGAIADLCQMETHGVHFSGMTSRGKTIALKLGTSAWSNPQIGRGLLSTWRSTDNAFEATAAVSNGTIMAVDELKGADGRLIAKTLFQLTSGTSKSRSNLSQTLQRKLQWTTFVVTSGEQSLKEKVLADKGDWVPGMSVRFTDIDVTDVNSQVEKALIEATMNGIQAHHGVAGPAFCRELVSKGHHNDPDQIRQQVHEAAANLAGPDADGSRQRAAMPLALILVAGELAMTFGILPRYELSDAIHWAWQKYVQSPDAASLDPVQDLLDALQAWVASNWDVTLKELNTFERKGNSREADGWYDDDCVYILCTRIVDAAGIGLKRAQIARILDEQGLLLLKDADRKTCRRVPGMPGVTVYALDRASIGPSRPGGAQCIPTSLD